MSSVYTYKLSNMSQRKGFTLSIDADLIKQIKIRAIQEDKQVSELTEELYRQYLKKKVKGKKR